MDTRTDNSEGVVELPIHIQRTELGEGEVVESFSVECPISAGATPLEHCLSCVRFRDLHVGEDRGKMTLWCEAPAVPLEAPEEGCLAALLEEIPLKEVMQSSVICVDPSLGVEELAEVLHRNERRAAPVVDEDGGLLGFVSKSDLVRGRARRAGAFPDPERFPPDCLGLTVEDIMSSPGVMLCENATLDDAMHLLVERDLQRIPVLAMNGSVIGILESNDLLRWVLSMANSVSTRDPEEAEG